MSLCLSAICVIFAKPIVKIMGATENLLPLAAEYLKYYPSDDLDKSFDDYVIDGGMSGSYLYPKQEDARKYVKSLARTTIIKDVVTKYKLENEV